MDWYPWGPEAWAKARAEDKPIFLSVGYATCHWCACAHVQTHVHMCRPPLPSAPLHVRGHALCVVTRCAGEGVQVPRGGGWVGGVGVWALVCMGN